MASIETTIQQFPKTLKKFSEKTPKSQLEKSVKNIKALSNANPAAYSDEHIAAYLQQRAKVMYELVDQYFHAAISKEFPLLSEDIFKLKRYITIETRGRKTRVLRDDTTPDLKKHKGTPYAYYQKDRRNVSKAEIPLFAYTELFKGEHKADLGEFSFTKRSSYNTRKITHKVEATLPGAIGQNLRTAYKEALGHYFKVMAKAYSDPVIGELLLQKPEQLEPEMGAIWIPTPESLSVVTTEEVIERKPIDPAMILKARGKSYIVTTWEVDNEEPFEKYLREFSVGSLKDKLK